MSEPVTSIFSAFTGDATACYAPTAKCVSSPAEPSAAQIMRNLLFLMEILVWCKLGDETFATLDSWLSSVARGNSTIVESRRECNGWAAGCDSKRVFLP